MNEPEPVDESKPAPEIRGGDRPADYIPEFTAQAGLASAKGGVPDNNKWASIHVGEDEDSDDENEYKDGGDC